MNIIIYGPTAVGKTGASLFLAKKLNAEILSADSAQIYRKLNIGTAKVSINEMEGIKHHLIDFLNPFEEFNASIFSNSSMNIINDLNKKGISTITVGGTALYLRALIDGMSDAPPSNAKIREKLETMSKEDLYDKLKEVDPLYAQTLSPNNLQRVRRALEIFLISGKSITKFNKNHLIDKNKEKIHFFKYALNMDRKALYERIDKRVDLMFEDGLLEEAINIYNKYGTLPKIIGYKELQDFIEGNGDLNDSINHIKKNSRNYAKRQITWLNKMEDFKIIDVEKYNPVEYILEDLDSIKK